MMHKNTLRRGIGGVLVTAALIAPFMVDFYTQDLIAEAAILAIFALSLDFLALSGLVSMGHAGLLGVGVYIFGGLTVLSGLPPSIAMVGATISGVILAIIVGLFAVRTTGAFFIMVTLSVSEMFFAWAFRSRLFNGADGMGGIPRIDLTYLGLDAYDPQIFAVLTVTICAIVWILLEFVMASPFGRTLDAIRQNADRVSALGGRVYLLRLAAFACSGGLAAFAGALKVQHTSFLSPDLASWFVSGDVLIVVVIGGVGTLVGGMMGAGILTFLKASLSGLVGHWHLVLGLIFIIVAIAMPMGIVGKLLEGLDRHNRGSNKKEQGNK